IAIDPNYALPHAGLAEAYFHAADVLFPPAEAMPKVGEEAQKALKIDPLLAEAHVSMGRYKAYYDWNWSEAEKEFRRAIELNPHFATAYHEYAVFLSWRGRTDEADRQMRRGLELDPVSVMINTDAGSMFYWRRQYDRAIDQFRKTIDLDPIFWGEHLYLGMVYTKIGAYADARAEFKKAKTLSEGSAVTLAAFGHLYAMSGKKSDALRVIGDLEQLSQTSYVSSYYLAIIYADLARMIRRSKRWIEP